jgi:hypothetical protein
LITCDSPASAAKAQTNEERPLIQGNQRVTIAMTDGLGALCVEQSAIPNLKA